MKKTTTKRKTAAKARKPAAKPKAAAKRTATKPKTTRTTYVKKKVASAPKTTKQRTVATKTAPVKASSKKRNSLATKLRGADDVRTTKKGIAGRRISDKGKTGIKKKNEMKNQFVSKSREGVTMGLINTTVGDRWLVVLGYSSREFKTEKGARNFLAKRGVCDLRERTNKDWAKACSQFN